MLLAILNLLEVLQSGCKLSQVFSQSLIFKGKLINFSFLLFQMICDTFVFREEVKLCLDSMVFLIQEINLILQFCHSLFVYILLILHTELLHVLATSVETTKP